MNLKRKFFVIISNGIKVFCGEKDIFLILMLFLLLEIWEREIRVKVNFLKMIKRGDNQR